MLTVLLPENEYSPALRALLSPLLPPGSVILDPDGGLDGLQNRRLLFAVALDEGGCNQSYYRMLSRLRRSETLLRGCVAGCVVTGVGEFYTKDVARDMVFAANQAGCAFLGRPLVEATGSLRNFRTQALVGGVDEQTAFHAAVSELLGRLTDWQKPAPIRRCDALVMLCANYNDALAANLTACINRLTALFRQTRMYDKRLFGLVVSGYSGGDLLARQLISALNMNKSFFLPPRFCLLETANERGSLIKLPGIDDRAAAFARRLAAD